MAPRFTWQLRSCRLALAGRVRIMGIVNVTPDSFSDGGRFLEPAEAVEHALALLDQGADLLDIGGESTRPGTHERVSAEEELQRVLPVIQGILARRPEALISVDTYKAEVAEAAVRAGAEIVNDVSGGAWDDALLPRIASLECACVLMHMRGTPGTWRSLPLLPAAEVIPLVKRELGEIAQRALAAGIGREHIVLDPGFGFGKSFEENYPLLADFDKLHELGFPLLAGTSRKSFIGRALARNGTDIPVNQRLQGSVAAAVLSSMKGAHIVRVHDVKETREALRVVEAVQS